MVKINPNCGGEQVQITIEKIETVKMGKKKIDLNTRYTSQHRDTPTEGYRAARCPPTQGRLI